MPNPNNEDVKWLYGKLKSKGYDIGSEQDFSSSLANEADRKWYYEKAKGMGLDMGSMDDFNSLYAPAKEEPKPAAQPAPTATAQPQAAPAKTATVQPMAAQPTQEQTQAAQPAAQASEQQEQKPVAEPMTEQQKVDMTMQLGQMLGDTRAMIGQTRQNIVDVQTYAKKAPLGGNVVNVGKQFNAASGKMEDVYMTPNGGKTTDKNLAEQSAHEYRVMQGFRDRMKANGLDAENAEDVQKQFQLDLEEPMRNAVAELWGEADAKHKADREANAKKNWDAYAAMGGGREMRIMTTAQNTQDDMVSKLTRYDLEKMMDDTWNRVPEHRKQGLIATYRSVALQENPNLKGAELDKKAEEIARAVSDNVVFEYAKEQNAPKSTLDFFARKVADVNVMGIINKGLAVNRAGTTGDMAAHEAVMAEWDKDHKVASIMGTVVGMAVDPVTYVSGAVGGAVGGKAAQLTGQAMLKGASAQVARRYAQGTLAGRIVQGVAGGSANFGTFETLKEIENQFVHGGYINPETGENEGFSIGGVLKQTGHGLLLGGATGSLSPIIGNVADKAVKATASTAGKVGLRVGETAVSALAEGTVFSIPEWISGERDAMDVWSDNMAMMLGFKASHAVKSAPRVLAGLKADGKRVGMNFEERLRRQLDASPADAGFTKEELAELREKGYTDLSMLFADASNKKVAKQRAKGNPKSRELSTDVEGIDAYESLMPDTFDGYEAMERLMKDNSVSEAARAKAYYILTGHSLPMSSVTGYTEDVAEDGSMVISSLNADGGVVTSRRFTDAKAAQMERDKIMRQAELNSVQVGEKYKEQAANMMVVETAIKELLPEADFETVLRNYKLVKSGEITDEAYVSQAKAIDEAIVRNKNVADLNRPEAIRAQLKEETDVDVDAALRKMPSDRTLNEQDAVQRYVKKLFPEQERMEDPKTGETYTADEARDAEFRLRLEERQQAYDEGKEAFVVADEQGDTADADAIVLRMQEAREEIDRVFGDESEMRMAMLEEDPWDVLLFDHSLNEEQKDAVLYYINSKAALDGLSDSANDTFETRRAEVKHKIDLRTHRVYNDIEPATLKVDDKQVYVVGGYVVMFPDGSAVDKAHSSESVVICDAETGEMRFIDPDMILRVDEPISAEDELRVAMEQIDQQEAAFNNAFAQNGNNGGENIPQNGNNGGENIPAEGEQRPQYTQEGIDNAYRADLAQRTGAQPYMTEQLRGAIGEQMQTAQQNHEAQMKAQAEAEAQRKEAEAKALAEQEAYNNSPLGRIPKDEKGMPLLEQTDPETAWDGAVQFMENEDDARDYVQSQVKTLTTQAKNAADAVGKITPSADMAKFKEAKAAARKKQAELEARLAQWQAIANVNTARKEAEQKRIAAERAEADLKAHEKAVTELAEQKRIEAEKKAEQERVGAHAVNPKIKEKWDAAPKVVGAAHTMILPDGTRLKGHYVLTIAGAATPSHDANNAFAPSEGYPVNENGLSVNDRDYQRDMDAQNMARTMAGEYDGRALQNVPTVSEGIVIDGNNRTISGELAAQNGTDGQYIADLKAMPEQFGVTAEQVADMEKQGRPRMTFVLDEPVPYTTETFAKFNAQTTKTQSNTEAAVKMGKVVSDQTFGRIATSLGQYDRLSDFYGDKKASRAAVMELAQQGVVNEMALPALLEGDGLSGQGQDLLENVLVGKVFEGNPEAVRSLTNNRAMRQAVVMGMAEIAHNRTLGDHALTEELSKAVDLVARAKAADADLYKVGVPVSPFGRQLGLFADEYGDESVTDATTLMLADILNSAKPSELRRILASYNSEAADAAAGQLDIFSGMPRTKEELLKDINEHYNNATAREQQAIVDAAIADRKRRAAEAAGEAGDAEESQGQGGDAISAGSEGGVRQVRNVGKKFSEAEAADILSRMEERAEQGEFVELTPETWDEQFGEDGIVSTPIGDVKMGENQVAKLFLKKRTNEFGYIKPTLTNPDVIIEKHAPADGAERDSKYLFVKTFIKPDGSRLVNYESVTVSKSGMEVSISSHEVDGSVLKKEMQNGIVLHLNDKLSLSSEEYLTETQNQRPDLVPTPDNDISSETTEGLQTAAFQPHGPASDVSDGKVTDSSGVSQDIDVKLSELGATSSAEEVQAAREGMNTAPTEAQKKAGNYKKGRIKVDGYDIALENPKGSVRSGKDADGKEWSIEMKHDYGYIRGIKGVDGDEIDVYLSDTPTEGNVYVVDQVNQKDGSFDEHKVMYGFKSMEEAVQAYRDQYEDGWKVGTVTEVSREEFKKWIESSNRKTKPFSEYKRVNTLAAQSGDVDQNVGKTTTSMMIMSTVYDNVTFLRKDGDTLYFDLGTNTSAYEMTESQAIRCIEVAAEERGEKVDGKAVLAELIAKTTENTSKTTENVPEIAKSVPYTITPTQSDKELKEERDAKSNEEKAKAEKPQRKIDDYGEQIAGARKDALKDLAKGVENVTEQSLIANTLSKVWKKPNLEKLVEKGVLTDEEAKFVDALMSVVDNWRKPKAAKGYKAKVQEEKIVSWAKHTRNALDVIQMMFEADAEGRKAIMESASKLTFPMMENEKAEAEQVRAMNQDRGDWKPSAAFGTCFTPNEVYVAMEMHKRLGKSLGDKMHTAFRLIAKPYSHDGYRLQFADGEKFFYHSFASIDDAMDYWATQEKLLSGDSDVEISPREIGVTTGRREYVDNGRWEVKYMSKGRRSSFDIKTFEYDTKEEADKKCAELNAKEGYDVLEPRPQKEWKTVSYKVYTNLVNGDRIESSLEFETSADAHAAIEQDYERVNSDLVEQNQKALEAKGEKQAKSRFELMSMWNVPNKKTIWLYGQKVNMVFSNFRRLSPEFDSKQEAEAWFKEHEADLNALIDKIEEAKKNFVFFKPDDNGAQKADHRSGKNMTEKDLGDAFGFRGIQFGNWTNDRDRQEAVNQAYDALMDMAAEIGISPKAVSLGGQLGLAFGSRGSGSANAHYEPSNVVINLTKTRGAGSLAHEWWHALDNYFARAAGMPVDLLTSNATVRKQAVESGMLRGEIADLYGKLVEAVEKSSYGKRQAERSAYWKDPVEMTARLFDAWITKRMRDKDAQNGFLSHAYSEEKINQWKGMMYNAAEGMARLAGKEMPMSKEEFFKTEDALRGYPNPTAEEIEELGGAMQKIFDTMQERVDEKGAAVLYEIENSDVPAFEQSQREAAELAVDLVRGSGIEVSMDEKEMADVLAANERLQEMKKSAQETASSPKAESHQTVVSSADGAKILKNLRNEAKKIENLAQAPIKTFIGDTAKALGMKPTGRTSQYGTFETANGKLVTIRLSDHNSEVKNWDDAGVHDGISILITSKPNEGIKNNGEAHVTEVYYNSMKLRKAEGKPLAEIVRSIEQSLYSGEFKDTTGLAEVQEVNGDEAIQKMMVYHGSGADFDAFDHSHMGEGEGNQSFGWGTYVTDVKGVAKGYAISQEERSDRLSILAKEKWIKERKQAIKAKGDYEKYAKEIKKNIKRLEKEYKAAKKSGDEADIKFYEELIEVAKSGLDRNKHRDLLNSFQQDINKAMSEIDGLKAKHEGKHNLYKVKIPNDTGENYLSWEGALTEKQFEAIENAVEGELGIKHEVVANGNHRFEVGDEYFWLYPNGDNGKDLYLELVNMFDSLGSKGMESTRKASALLSRAGLVGIKYSTNYFRGGNEDGKKNYVIFNEADAKITDKTQFLKTRKGEVYGFVKDGKMYLDPKLLNPNTPIHEYTHIWDMALQKKNPELWEHGKELMKQTPLWEEVKQNPAYADIAENEDLIASEVHSRLTGEEGARILEDMVKEAKEKNNGILDEAEKMSLIGRLRKWISDAWKWVKDTMTPWTKEEAASVSLDDFVKMPLKDLVEGKKLPKTKGYGVQKQTEVTPHNFNEKVVEMAEKHGIERDVMNILADALVNNEVKDGHVMERLQKAEQALRWMHDDMLAKATPEELARDDNNPFRPTVFSRKRGMVMNDIEAVFGRMDVLRNNAYAEENEREFQKAQEEQKNVEKAKPENELKALANDPNFVYDEKAGRYKVSKAGDKAYKEAVKRGDMETAQEMVEKAALAAGYYSSDEFRMMHTAPTNDGFSKSVKNIAEGDDLVPSDYWEHPEWYGNNEGASAESFRKIRSAITSAKNTGKGRVWMYRAVPKDLKEETFRNGDWITPSREYAKEHGESNIDGKYKIISEHVRVDQIWWNGDDINEWGYDDGNAYAYQNTKNNRKLLDAVTYDSFKQLVPLSKRFSKRNSDVRFRVIDNSETELLDFLNGQPTESGFRYAQWANYGILPPMTAKKNGEWRAPMIMRRWEQSEEGMKNANGKADLVQGNGRTTGDVAYNPYFHIRQSPLNDQFVAAYDRPELLVIKGDYPTSELTSGYRAEGAKDSVGLMAWHSGSANAQLSEDTKVNTMLSRYFRPERIVPWSEVADEIMQRVGDQNVVFPINTVPPFLRMELAKRGAKFGPVSGQVAEADIPMLEDIMHRVNNGEVDAGLEKARAYMDAYESSNEAKEARVQSISEKLGVPVRIVREGEVENLPTARQRKAKGWWSAKTDEVVVVLDNNVNVADIDNTVVHEIVGHKGLRQLVGEERFDEFLDEVYGHIGAKTITAEIDKMTQKLVDAEVDRLTRAKNAEADRPNERKGVFSRAEATVEAEQKREQLRREATEEYMSDMAGRIGEEGFEKMSAEELTFWGKVKAKVQKFLDKFLQGLGLGKMKLTEKDLAYILYKSWKNLKNQGKPSIMEMAEDAVMREKTGYGKSDKERFRDGEMGLDETITSMKAEIASKNADDMKAKNEAIAAIGGNLGKLRRAMRNQKQYDYETVKSMADLAQVLMDNGMLDKMSAYETKRILSSIKGAVGKEDLAPYVDNIMDIMVGNQLRAGETQFGRLLSMKGTKLNSAGVQIKADLDPEGDACLKAVKDYMRYNAEDIDAELADLTSKIGDDNPVVAADARVKYRAAVIGKRYIDEIAGSKADEQQFAKQVAEVEQRMRGEVEALADKYGVAKTHTVKRKVLKDGAESYEDKEQKRSYREIIADVERAGGDVSEAVRMAGSLKALKEAKRDCEQERRIARIESYASISKELAGVLGESAERAKAWADSEVERVNKIHHFANSDMQGRELQGQRKERLSQKLVNNPIAQFALQPLVTFDQMMKMFGSKNANGEGYLHNHYMRGWADAADGEQLWKERYHKLMDDKAREIGVKNFMNLYDYADAGTAMTLSYYDGTAMREYELNQDQLLYLYAVDKMPMGHATNANMGIDEEVMAQIAEVLDPRLRAFADWVQEEMLPDMGVEIDDVHQRMFGAHMDNVADYFPFVRDEKALKQEVENGAQSQAQNNFVTTQTGAIKKRKASVAVWDMQRAKFLDVLAGHVQTMCHWANFAELNRDINALLSYNRFKQQVMGMSSVYGSGAELWKQFKDVCAIATECYTPQVARADKAVTRIAKGVTLGKIAFRPYTALKQALSLPAFAAEASVATLSKDLAMGGIPAVKWAWKNMPSFRKRILSRTTGDYRLRETEYDTKIMKAASIGMFPNMGVDAWTIAVGSHGVYEKNLAKYKRWGMSDEEAERRAIQDAELCFNKSQQSSEGPFLAPVQVDRTWWSSASMLFRNASTSYTREAHNSMRNLKRIVSGEVNEEFMAKQWLRLMHPESEDAWSDEQWSRARRHAKEEKRQATLKNAVNLVTFGWVLPWFWRLGGIAPLLLLSGDSGKKDEELEKTLKESVFAPMEGLFYGDVAENALNMAAGLSEKSVYGLGRSNPLLSDMSSMAEKALGDKKLEAANELVNLLGSMLTGINPQTITDWVVAGIDFFDDRETQREYALLVSRIFEVPQSQLDQFYFEELSADSAEVSKMTPNEVAARYAEYKRMRQTPLTGWLYSDAEAKEARDKYKEKAVTKAKEILDRKTDGADRKELEAWREEYKTTDAEIKRLRKLLKEGDVEAKDEFRALVKTPEFVRHEVMKAYNKYVDKVTKLWLSSKTPEDREKYADMLASLKERMTKRMKEVK